MSELGVRKKYSRCRKPLLLEAFASNRSTPDGCQAYCRVCSAEYYRQRQAVKGRTVREKVFVPDGHKYCPQCGEVKPHDQWGRNATSSGGFSSYCKVCRAVQGRAQHLKRQYGITEAEREEMVAWQMGVCPICLSAPAVHVDHCHETGKVRGVLCFNCNSAPGKLRDDPATARRAANYLEGTVWKPPLGPSGACLPLS